MMKKKPMIGVMPLWDEEKNSLWVLPGYLDGIRMAGGIPVIFPLTTQKDELTELCSLCSGFLFTGGQDVSPELYREQNLEGLSKSYEPLDEMERIVLQTALIEDKAVLGICRGLQFINVFLGGILYQDLSRQHPSLTEHHMTPPYDREIHKVTIKKSTPLYQLLSKECIGVNSYHHQAVKETAPALSVMATAEDGLVEAAYLPDKKYVWAFQWHPEFSYQTDENSRRIFSSFVEAAEE